MRIDLPQFTSTQHRHIVTKGWGCEDWIWNDKEFCGKRLFFDKDKKCSFHKHIIKRETLLVQYGQIIMRYGWDKNIDYATDIQLFAGDAFYIPRNLYHQMIAVEDSLIFEVSTHHEDSDSIRSVKGD